MSPLLDLGPQRIRLEHLTAAPDNPRTISVAKLEQLKHTLAGRPEMLEMRPLIPNRSGVVLAGNQRLRALLEMQEDYKATPYEGALADVFEDGVPSYVVDPSAAMAREIMLLDNQPFGRWDDDGLRALVQRHAADGADLRMLGFGDVELKALARPVPVPAMPAGPPAAKVRTIVQLDRDELDVVIAKLAGDEVGDYDALARAREILSKARARLAA